MSGQGSGTTLLFRHLPSELTQDERKDLLHHLGAKQVRVFGSQGPMKNTAFAVFSNVDEAKEVVSQLHQTEFLGSRLVVEFAKPQSDNAPSMVDKEGMAPKQTNQGSEPKEGTGLNELSETEKKMREPKEIKFDATFNSWGLKYPRRPQLHYQYPPPTPTTLTNILHALAAVPKFYVQVLHLMNKMDLPAPFGMVTSAPPVRPDVQMEILPDDVGQREMDISSSAESELESDEGEGRPSHKEPKPKRAESKRRPIKRQRLSDLHDAEPAPLPPTSQVPVSEIFDIGKDGGATAKKISLKLPSSINLPPPHPHPTNPPQLPQSYYLPLPAQNPPFPPPDDPTVQRSQPSSDLYDPFVPLPIPPLPSSLEGDLERSRSGHDPIHLSQKSVPSHVPSPLQLPLPPTTDPSEQQGSNLMYGPHPPREKPDSRVIPSTGQKENAVISSDAQSASTGGFGILQPVHMDVETEDIEESSEKEWTKGKFISSSQLKRSRLSKSEMQELSVFKRYSEGQPSCRLYIKNLAKHVSEEDLHWVYGRYVDWDQETEANIFDIRLMKEGRMKGQAFVTLPSEDAATQALKDTNGFLYKEKPMVVQFARSAKAEEDKASIAKE